MATVSSPTTVKNPQTPLVNTRQLLNVSTTVSSKVCPCSRMASPIRSASAETNLPLQRNPNRTVAIKRHRVISYSTQIIRRWSPRRTNVNLLNQSPPTVQNLNQHRSTFVHRRPHRSFDRSILRAPLRHLPQPTNLRRTNRSLPPKNPRPIQQVNDPTLVVSSLLTRWERQLTFRRRKSDSKTVEEKGFVSHESLPSPTPAPP